MGFVLESDIELKIGVNVRVRIRDSFGVTLKFKVSIKNRVVNRD